MRLKSKEEKCGLIRDQRNHSSTDNRDITRQGNEHRRDETRQLLHALIDVGWVFICWLGVYMVGCLYFRIWVLDCSLYGWVFIFQNLGPRLQFEMGTV